MGAPPLVIAGEQSWALPAKGSIHWRHAAAAACGLKFDCELRSGSLNLRG